MPIPLKLVMTLLGKPVPEEYITPEEAISLAFGRTEVDLPPTFNFQNNHAQVGPESLIETKH